MSRPQTSDWSESPNYDKLQAAVDAVADLPALKRVHDLTKDARGKPGAVQDVAIYPIRITGEDPAGLVEKPGDQYVMVRLNGHPVTYYVRAGLTDDGPVVVSLVMDSGGGHLTHDGLRRIPLKRLAAVAARLHVNPRDDHASDLTLPDLPAADLVARPETEPKRKRGRPGRTPEQLRKVAEIAESARLAGRPMHTAVAKELHVSESTARRAIQHATDAGYRKRTRPSQKPSKENGQ